MTNLYEEGMARLEQGEVEEGRRMLEEALQANPGDVKVMHGLALALDMAGERLEARTLLERANAQAPTEPGPACDLSMMYLELESDARAARVLEPVLAAHPEDARVQLHMAMALAKLDPLRARGHAEKALSASEPELHQQAETLLRALQVITPA
jgi:Flp pilus assembly protein TadD